jgi:hypothetical protein
VYPCRKLVGLQSLSGYEYYSWENDPWRCRKSNSVGSSVSSYFTDTRAHTFVCVCARVCVKMYIPRFWNLETYSSSRSAFLSISGSMNFRTRSAKRKSGDDIGRSLLRSVIFPSACPAMTHNSELTPRFALRVPCLRFLECERLSGSSCLWVLNCNPIFTQCTPYPQARCAGQSGSVTITSDAST